MTLPVSVATSGDYTVAVGLLDEHGWQVTSTEITGTLPAGAQSLTADLAGADIGDAGATGPFSVHVTVRPKDTPDTGACVLIDSAAIGALDPSTFDGWFTSLARLQARLSADIAAGWVSGDAATSLPQALETPSADAPDLGAFRGVLAGAQVVSDFERVRLDSLAARLIAQASAGTTP